MSCFGSETCSLPRSSAPPSLPCHVYQARELGALDSLQEESCVAISNFQAQRKVPSLVLRDEAHSVKDKASPEGRVELVGARDHAFANRFQGKIGCVD
jgi:hypothetical protein